MAVPAYSLFQSGKVNKTAAGEMTITFPRPFSNAVPNVVVSPIWTRQVGQIETITKVTNTDFTITSGNADPEYFVSWIAAGTELE